MNPIPLDLRVIDDVLRAAVYEDLGSRQIPIYNGERIAFGSSRLMEDGDTFSAAGVLFRYRD